MNPRDFHLYDCYCIICENEFLSKKKNVHVCKPCISKNLHNAEDLVDSYFIHWVYDDIKLEKLYERLKPEGKILMAHYLQHLINTGQIDWNWTYLGYDNDYDGSVWNI